MARVLIVDDDPEGRKLLVTLVRYRGHEAFEASDGAEALDAVRRHSPDLVMSDILMPTMDGYEFVRRLRADSAVGGTRVIFYTASYHEREAIKLAEVGRVSRVLVKPAEPADIIRAIEEAVADVPLQQSAATTEEFDDEHLRLVTDKLWQRTTELESANARLGVLADLHVELASQRDPRTLLKEVCVHARKLFGARYAVLAVRDKSANGNTFHAVSGLDASGRLLEAPLVESGALGKVCATRKPWRIARDDEFTIDAGLPDGYPRARAYMAVPIASLTHVYGWICLAEKVGAREFTEVDERLFVNLGAQVGRIYENGSLYLELNRRATLLQEEMTERERATNKLRASEQRFRQLAENIRDAFFVASGDLSELSYLSPAYAQIWGHARPDKVDCESVLLASVHPGDAGRVRDEFRRAASGNSVLDTEYRIQRRDRSVRWVRLRMFPVFDPEAETPRVVGTATDVTERREARSRIEHLNRVYAVLSNINALIVRVREREELFREACRLAVQDGKFAVAWVGWLDPETGAIPPIAWAGARPDILRSAVPVLGPRAEDDGVVAAAIRTGEPQIVNDIESDPRTVIYRREILQEGFRGLIALPLTIDAKPAGCLVLITAETGFFNQEELRLLVELAGDISFALDHLEKTERLHYLAYFDELTGLANRTLFLDRLALHLEHATRSGGRLALVAMAPERLGNINDTFGRPAGDLVLKQFAQRFTDAIGNTHDIARVTGDQIAVVVDASGDQGEVLAKVSRWQEDCFGRPFDVHGMQIRIGATTGIAIHPDDGRDAPTLLKNAEAALERAKTTGDEHLFYSQRMSAAVTEKMLLEQSLRTALERGEFELHYQPKVCIERRQVRGVEALLRWRSAERGLMPPASFIALMEETGMIVQVGAWVIRRAAEQRAEWLRLGIQAPRVAVNVSAVQVRKRDFLATVRNALKEGGKAPGIDFEVTESLIMEDVESNIQKLEDVARMGIGIALDDFGTGYSSLGYLARLPVDTLKIDRSFIMKMLEDPGAMTLVSTIISLAHSLKLTVVAEGVESEEQAKILRLLRCDELQGYLVSKPLPFAETTELLRRSAGNSWQP